jgi:hypothetical protein
VPPHESIETTKNSTDASASKREEKAIVAPPSQQRMNRSEILNFCKEGITLKCMVHRRTARGFKFDEGQAA